MSQNTVYSLLSFTAFIIYLYFGILVFKINIKSKLHQIFFALCISLAIWSFCETFIYSAPTYQSAWFWFKAGVLGWGFFGSISLQFFLELTDFKYKRIKKAIIYLIFVPAYIDIISVLVSHSIVINIVRVKSVWIEIYSNKSPVYFIHNVNIIVCVIASMVLTYIWGKKSNYRHIKKQAKMILLFSSLSFIFGVANSILLPALFIKIMPPISHMFILFFIFGIGYSIKNYNLMTLTTEIAANEIIERIMDLLVMTDSHGKIIMVNKITDDILGYRNKELIGKDFFEIVYEQEQIREILDQLRYGNFPVSKIEIFYKTAANELTPVSLSISSVKDKNGFLLGFVLVAQDIRLTKRLQYEVAERKRIAESLLQSNQTLKELDNLKSEFLSTVSHELRTPLTSVLGFARIIQKKLNDIILPSMNTEDKLINNSLKQICSNINIIVSEGERLTSLINDVLDIAKMEAGKMHLVIDNFNLTEIINQSIATVTPLIEQKKLNIKTDIKEDLKSIKCDKYRIMQVLINLLSNAIKFSDKGTITCAVHTTNNFAIITVGDEGIGIAEENLDNVFEKFKQVGDTLTDKPKGTGLGLPICKQIVEYHGGEIWVVSEINKGSKFLFSLPLNTTVGSDSLTA